MRLLLTILFSLIAVTVQAQSATAQWDHTMVPGQVLADYNAATATLKIDAASPVTLTQTCVTIIAPNGIRCSAPVTITPGPHTLKLDITNAFGTVSTTVTGAPPTLPSGFKIVILITVP